MVLEFYELKFLPKKKKKIGKFEGYFFQRTRVYET